MKLNPKTTLKMFHLRTEPIKRSAGRSVVGASAYRTASKIKDDRLNKTFNYSSKKGVVKHDCFMYKDGNKIKLDPSQLWNNAEQAEKRKDGRTGRDYIINLPYQWTDEQRIEAVENFSKWLAETYKVGVQYAIHLPDEQGDQRNHHVHILTTTRELDIDKDYKVTFGRKTDLEMENAELKKQGKPVTQDQIKNIRMEWANEANRMFDKAGLALRIDHRSYKDQKLYQIPTAKLGVKASGMERKGIQTDKGDYNRLVAQANAENWKGDIVSYMDKRLDELEHEIIVESRKQAEPIIEQSDKPTIGKPVEQSPQLTTVAPVLVEKSDKASEQTPPPVAKTRTAQAYLDELKKQLGETVAPVKSDDEIIKEYTTKRTATAKEFWKKELQSIAGQGKPYLDEYNELSKKQSLWGKVATVFDELTAYESRAERAKTALDNYNDYKRQFDELKKNGVNSSHLEQADTELKRIDPDLYNQYQSIINTQKQAEQAERDRLQREFEQRLQAEQHRQATAHANRLKSLGVTEIVDINKPSRSSYIGAVVKVDGNGLYQKVGNDTVLHPHYANFKGFEIGQYAKLDYDGKGKTTAYDGSVYDMTRYSNKGKDQDSDKEQGR